VKLQQQPFQVLQILLLHPRLRERDAEESSVRCAVSGWVLEGYWLDAVAALFATVITSG
jgi:hypothetical protein